MDKLGGVRSLEKLNIFSQNSQLAAANRSLALFIYLNPSVELCLVKKRKSPSRDKRGLIGQVGPVYRSARRTSAADKLLC